MKKLYMLLLGLLICTAASAAPAAQLYLIGEPAGGWSPLKGLGMEKTADGVFEIDVNLTGTKWFGFAQKLGTSASDWNTMNGSRYGAPSNNYTPTLDTPVSLRYPNENSFQLGAGEYRFIVDTNNNTFTVTGQEVEDPTANVLYVRGGSMGWDATEANKMTQDGNTYTITLASLSGEFKIANSDYSQQFSAANPIELGVETTVENLGQSNSKLAVGSASNVTLTFVKESNIKGKLTITTETAWEAPAKAYFSGNLAGDWAFNTEMTAKGNGVFTLEDIEVSATTGYVTFTTGLMNNWTVADGIRYGSGSEDVAVETGQSYPAVAGSDKAFTLAQGTWKAELTFTQEATTVVFTQTQAVVPTAPEALYFHGSIDGDWAFNTEMTKAENTFSHDFEVSNETGYITFSTALMDNWTVAAGGVRYVPENGADVTIESGVAYKMATGTMGSWSMGTGKYTAVVDFTEAIPTVTFTRTGDIVIPEYPELYFRATDNGWGADESNLMSCDKGVYTITLATLNGSFKIAAKTWDDATTASSENLKMAVGETYIADHHPFGGNNMSMAETLSDATVVYDANEGTIKVTGTVTECVHTYMLHGQFTAAPADEPEAEVMALEEETPWNDIELSEINGRYTTKVVPAAAEGQFVVFTKRNGVDHLTLKAAEGTTLTAEGNITLSPIETADVNYSLDPSHSYELSLDPETYAISSKDAGTTGIEGIGVDNSSVARYFNLQGVSVENPSNGLYIVVRNGKATKEYIR